MGLEHRRAFFEPVERRSRMPEQVPPQTVTNDDDHFALCRHAAHPSLIMVSDQDCSRGLSAAWRVLRFGA